MGLLNFIFKKDKKKNDFSPDFNLSEYDNLLNFLDYGGNSDVWEIMKKENNWKFPKDSTEIFMEYQEEVRPISDKYYRLLKIIEKDWSALYNSKDYNSALSNKVERECIDAIECFKKMRAIDIKYGEMSPKNIPAFKRLAMLYERRSDYERAADICKQAIFLEMDERPRMLRMIKKAGRTPTDEEMELINSE
ncbi:MAG TPA: hypothetical protein H9754_00600 [Candidatus Anaerostipes avistercoris]|uniref:Tetratricopeptide repeat protein n=1 Tax=Candidatus Anaerostipes avistercoris TaxID=2838462 RepID=A0A9D2PE28_9FIRM|nr:hypothetical protein [Candidatus Anaerostipes avistercoris]